MDQQHIGRTLSLCASALVALALAGCDNGAGGGDGNGGSTSAGSPTSTTGTGSPTSTTGAGSPTSSTTGTGISTSATTGTATTSSSGGTGVTCAMGGYCSQFGMGGYAFAYADSGNVAPQAPGTSTATLAASDLCISGNVMQLPMNPTPDDYSNDWGCGIGVNLNQMMGTDMPKNTYVSTLTGVTVTVNGVPDCTTARVIVDQDGTGYCAALTSGAEIPWATFNTTCWMAGGTALTGAPMSQAVKVQFVTSGTEACPYTDFCITGLSI